MTSLLRTMRNVDEALVASFDRAFPPAANPWRHLGALAFLCFVVALGSGIVAYALYDTSVAGAYDSGRRLQQDPLLLGRLLRGLHRYAADGFMLLTVLHLLREGARGHFLSVRWFSWLSGVPLIWLLWIAGLTGLWLLWDEGALASVAATAEWLQALPLATDLLARNFLTPAALNDRFFSLIVFIHIGVPLLLLAAVWVHVQRISHARVWPPRGLAIGTILMLAILAMGAPARSLGPADPGHLSAAIPIDWFFQFAHPLMDAFSAQGAWLLAAAATALLASMPLLPLRRGAARAAARVDPANCNGCERCAADCPFGAVVMVPRVDARNPARQASVIEASCAACGICVGACPSSTPFRSMRDIVSGIELPELPVAELREQLRGRLSALAGSPRILLLACREAADFQSLADTATAVVPTACAGMVPPSFAEYAFRLGANGVVIAGCRESDCEYRLGDRWLEARIAGLREPRLRASVPRARIAIAWSGRDFAKVREALSSMRGTLQRG